MKKTEICIMYRSGFPLSEPKPFYVAKRNKFKPYQSIDCR